MFVIEKRKVEGNTVGNWFRVWGSQDGADCAVYLRQCVELDNERRKGESHGEYRMIYVIS